MALLFVESFDHWATADIQKKWTATVNSSYNIETGTFRTGIASMRITNQNTNIRKSFPSSVTTIVIGLAFQFSGMQNTNRIIDILEGTTSHVSIQISNSNTLQAYRGPASVSLGLGSQVLAPGIWYYLETKVFVHDSTGTVECRLNGSATPDINLTGQDTRNGQTGVIDGFNIGGGGSGGPTVYFDDIYVLDTSGGAPQNDFLGDCRVDCLMPNGNGNSSQFDGSDGNQTDNYLLVDEDNSDSDTTYVESPDVNDKDTYAYENLVPATGTVYAIQLVAQMRKTDAGGRSVRYVVRHSGTEEDSAADIALADGYTIYRELRTTKPGGGAFSISDVNGMEAGLKVTT